MPISTTDLLIAIGVYAASIVLTLLWVHLSSQTSIARSAKSYLGITLRMALVHTVVVMFCGYPRLPIRWVAMPVVCVVTFFPSALAQFVSGGSELGFAFEWALFIPPYVIKQYILGFPDRDVFAPEPDVMIPERSQLLAAAKPQPGLLTGKLATVVTTLKPSGTVLYGGKTASGDF
jgi:hypothetical protein